MKSDRLHVLALMRAKVSADPKGPTEALALNGKYAVFAFIYFFLPNLSH